MTATKPSTPVTEDHPPTPTRPEPPMRLCVLASGSAGNCTVLLRREHNRTRLCLIDAGLSPRRTTRLLAQLNLRLHDVEDILLTHLDTDHLHPGWVRGTRDVRAIFRIHRRHRGRAERAGLLTRRTALFDEEPFDLWNNVTVAPLLLSHDTLGVAAFRFDARDTHTSLGMATDLGHPTPNLVEHMHQVDVLAIESNYCPDLQAASDRPEFLKRRITGGAGHLSNPQCAEATTAINPTTHVVLLHLSRQCNTPALAAQPHENAHYSLTITAQDEPTPWIPVRQGTPHPQQATMPTLTHHAPTLFDPAPPATPAATLNEPAR